MARNLFASPALIYQCPYNQRTLLVMVSQVIHEDLSLLIMRKDHVIASRLKKQISVMLQS